jgi:hypothetical protein
MIWMGLIAMSRDDIYENIGYDVGLVGWMDGWADSYVTR